jgi:hypothetical protein
MTPPSSCKCESDTMCGYRAGAGWSANTARA